MQAGLDIGNTRSKLGLYFGDGTIKMIYLERESEAIFEAIRKFEIDELIVSSVSDLMVEDVKLMKTLKTFVSLSHHTPLPITLEYNTPETLGRDRIALAAGAVALRPGRHQPYLVIDAGTCITMDIVDANGTFCGGSICPGMTMRLKAMNTFTANLPLVSLEDWTQPVGKSTAEALNLGAGLGAISEIEGFYDRMKEDYPGLDLILTGGDADFISKKIKRKIFLHPELLHIGLREILRHNAN